MSQLRLADEQTERGRVVVVAAQYSSTASPALPGLSHGYDGAPRRILCPSEHPHRTYESRVAISGNVLHREQNREETQNPNRR